MASTTSSDRAKCKHNKVGKVCRCQEWGPSEADESLCECCTHHMSFPEYCHPNAEYGRDLHMKTVVKSFVHVLLNPEYGQVVDAAEAGMKRW